MKGNRYEAHVPTEHPQAREVPWLPCPYVHQGRPRRSRTPSRQGPQAPDRLISTLETIKSSAEITNLFNEGRRIGTKHLTLIVLRNEKQHGQHGRAAFIAGKKLGNAVWRNRAKRRMRAACSQMGDAFSGYDVLFVARRKINEVPFDQLLSQMGDSLARAGLI